MSGAPCVLQGLRTIPGGARNGFACTFPQVLMKFRCLILAVCTLAGVAEAQSLSDLGALTVAPESRCSPYDRSDYSYPQSVEELIVQAQGGAYSPYDGTVFESLKDSDIEHIVATSEAHDSGLCAAERETRKTFARDIDNLTLATPQLNRHQKSGKDAGEWLPAQNRCWFARTIVHVKKKYDLSVDQREYDALQNILV